MGLYDDLYKYRAKKIYDARKTAKDDKKYLGYDYKRDLITNRISRHIVRNQTMIDFIEFCTDYFYNTIEQIRVMTTRVDGDDLAKSIAIFDVTKQISVSLGELMNQNSFSGESTAKYYGIYVILSEILGFAQREYITKLDKVYLRRINEIKNNSLKSISMAENEIKRSQSQQSINIYKNNIKAERFTIEVADQYRSILLSQRAKLLSALKRTEEQISVGYSSYITAMNSSILSSLIQDTQSSFDQIMSMQIPEIIAFESTELESEFRKLSGKINS